jgi:D-alanyl-lipoteichoic acid acyltransferase DltB (MBOAT superfamily)
MTFNSLQYFVFFAIVLLLYYRLNVRGQNFLMVVAGSIFYALFDWRFVGLLYASILIDYTVGRALAITDDARSRNALLGVSLAGQLGILGFFKYWDFFTGQGTSFLNHLGLGVSAPVLHILLPVGISFYTFQTLAYIFAVYRRQIAAERDLITFATFVCWFPQLVAGPIERATNLLPQIKRRREVPSRPMLESGTLLIIRGLFKKIVIADSVASYVATVYAHPGNYGWAALVLATVGFAIQVYGDFSGYTDIARGSSRLLGVELRRNFEQPFLSRDIREFWQRWHTSLTSWFVEFVGGPLGGARRGAVRAMLNVLIIFSLIGLWHGASWHFVVWGALNGLLVVTWRKFFPVPKGRHPMRVRLSEAPGIIFTFALFCGGVVFFRAASLHDAGVVFTHILSLKRGAAGPSGSALVPIMLAVVVAVDLAERRQRINAIETLRVKATFGGVPTPAEAVEESPVAGLRLPSAGLVLGVAAAAILVFSGGTPTPFIYFHF